MWSMIRSVIYISLHVLTTSGTSDPVISRKSTNHCTCLVLEGHRTVKVEEHRVRVPMTGKYSPSILSPVSMYVI